MSGITCGNYRCNEDSIDYEDISDPDTCVAVDNEQCAKCESILGYRDANTQLFNSNPVKSIFGVESTEEKTERFWEQLKTKCKIERPVTSLQEAPINYVAMVNAESVSKNKEQIINRVNELGLNNETVTRIFVGLFDIALLSVEANRNPHSGLDFEDHYKHIIRGILEEKHCSIRTIHRGVAELPLVIELFFDSLVSSNNVNFNRVIEYINTKPQVCLEGFLDTCIAILSRQKGGKRKTKRIRKSRKYRKTKRYAKTKNRRIKSTLF